MPAARDIPPEFRDLPVLGFVRNPWDWYVSWYHYIRAQEQRKNGSESTYWSVVFDDGRRLLQGGDHGRLQRGAARRHPAPHLMERIREQDLDLYSLWCRQVLPRRVQGHRRHRPLREPA